MESKGNGTTADIAESQGISVSYVEQLFARLRRAGLVEATRAVGGGYRLARPAAMITIADIISCVEPPEAKRAQTFGDENESLPRDLWQQLSGRIHDFLDDMTLAHFVVPPDVRHFIYDEQVARKRRRSPLSMRH